MIESSDENDNVNKEDIYVVESTEEDESNEMVIYEVVSGHQETQNHTLLLHKYPHILIQLCDSEIINVESGESILNLSQFMVDNELHKKGTSVSTPSFPPSPQLIMDSSGVLASQTRQACQHLVMDNYGMTVQETTIINEGDLSSQYDIDN